MYSKLSSEFIDSTAISLLLILYLFFNYLATSIEKLIVYIQKCKWCTISSFLCQSLNKNSIKFIVWINTGTPHNRAWCFRQEFMGKKIITFHYSRKTGYTKAASLGWWQKHLEILDHLDVNLDPLKNCFSKPPTWTKWDDGKTFYELCLSAAPVCVCSCVHSYSKSSRMLHWLLTAAQHCL